MTGNSLPPPEGPLADQGEPMVPRPSASVLMLRDGEPGLEVLLTKRHEDATFMGGAWVFPGGAVDPEDGDGEAALPLCAIRELEEEAGVRIEPDQLVPFSRWITPEFVKRRFNTLFYLAAMPIDSEARPDGREMVEARWLAPADADAANQSGEMLIYFPTLKQLEQLIGANSVAEALKRAKASEVMPILPKLVETDEGAQILIPGDPGYPAN